MTAALETSLRCTLVEIGRRCWQRQFIASNDGNFSHRLDENRVLCTPTMISKGFMTEQDLVIIDLDGKKIAGHREPTSEVRLHLNLYRQRPDIHSVVHVHPPHATAFALTGRELPKGVLQEIEIFLGEVPLAPYATTGTWDFARVIDPWAANHDAFLLANHGAVTVGKDPYDAYYKMETLDQYCRILLLAAPLGEPKPISIPHLKELLSIKQRLGIEDPRPAEDLTSLGAHPAKKPHPGVYTPFRGPLIDSPK